MKAAKDCVNSMPEKGKTAKQLKKAVGCRIVVGYLDAAAMTGILLPGEKDDYRFLTVDRHGVLEIERFDNPDQVIHIDESGRRALLDIIFTSPAEAAAKAKLAEPPVPPVYILVGGRTITLTEKEARRVYEFLDGPCPLDPLEKQMAVKIGRGLNLEPLPSSRPISGNFTDKISESLESGLTSAE